MPTCTLRSALISFISIAFAQFAYGNEAPSWVALSSSTAQQSDISRDLNTIFTWPPPHFTGTNIVDAKPTTATVFSLASNDEKFNGYSLFRQRTMGHYKLGPPPNDFFVDFMELRKGDDVIYMYSEVGDMVFIGAEFSYDSYCKIVGGAGLFKGVNGTCYTTGWSPTMRLTSDGPKITNGVPVLKIQIQTPPAQP
jgi:hypothetical protein